VNVTGTDPITKGTRSSRSIWTVVRNQDSVHACNPKDETVFLSLLRALKRVDVTDGLNLE
jgi:hypothetical protein